MQKKNVYICLIALCTLWAFFSYFFQGFFSTGNWFSIVAGLSYYLIFILLASMLAKNYHKETIIGNLKKDKHWFIKLLLTGGLYGIFLDGLLQWITHLWYYPMWNPFFYSVIFIPGFTVYLLALTSGYLIFKIILEKCITFKSSSLETPHPKTLYIFSLALLTFFTFLYFLANIKLSPFLEHIHLPFTNQVNMPLFFVLGILLCLILDLYVWRKHNTGFMRDFFKKNYYSGLALFSSGIFMCITMELQNYFILKLWVYENWYFQDLQIFYIPLDAFLLWPIHVGLSVLVIVSVFPSTKKFFFS